MEKKLLAIGLLATGLFTQAQTVLCHVDNNAKVYVSKNTLVYNGGGFRVKGTGVWENHGNVMVVGNNSTDVFLTEESTGADKAEGSTTGGLFVNKLNEPTAYASVNTAATPSVYTYGQLYITGFSQANVKGIVDEEYRQVKHGDYHQIALPFYDKTLSTLGSSTEFNKTFTNTRWSKNEILVWRNPSVVFDYQSYTGKTPAVGTNYYILGSQGLDTSSKVYTIHGRPYAEEGAPTVTLTNAGNGINFGAGGNAINGYNEKYNTYLQDGFHIASGGTAWSGNYGKNLYQFGNPFLTNLDLRNVAVTDAAATGDAVNLSNIQGIRLEQSASTVYYQTNVGGGATNYRYVSFASNIGGGAPATPVGDVDYLIVRPLSTFVIKLKDNTVGSQDLKFTTLRRFNYLPRTQSTNYSVTAAKGINTVKQLGIIGLNSSGKEVARTYYAVSALAKTGHSTDAKLQMTATSNHILGTFEEASTGGYDNNYTSSYWLYINEANENDFKGKNIKLVKYSNDIKYYKFEIRENAELLGNGKHALSSGTGFYYKAPNGTITQAKQGAVIPASGSEYDIYYGMASRSTSPKISLNKPSNDTSIEDDVTPSRTMVVYNPEINNYVVIFDPSWKSANVDVYDMSGKLIISKKSVDTSSNFVIELLNSVKSSYIVKAVSDKGDKITTKILK